MKVYILDWSIPDQYEMAYTRNSSRKLFMTRELALAEKRKLEEAVKLLGMSATALSSSIMEVEVVE